MYDEFNCFQAGRARTKRAVRVALEVSQNVHLHGHLKYPQKLFEDSRLYRRHAKAEKEGEKDITSDTPMDEKVATLAERMYRRGGEIWSQGFIPFMHLTNMRFRQKEESQNGDAGLPPPSKVFTVPYDQAESLMGFVKYDAGDPNKPHFLIKSRGSWYRVPAKQIKDLAQAEGLPDQQRREQAVRDRESSRARMKRGSIYLDAYNEIETLLEVADMNSDLLINSSGTWYRVPLSKVQDLAREMNTAKKPTEEGIDDIGHTESTGIIEGTDAEESFEESVATTPLAKSSSDGIGLRTPHELSVPPVRSSTPDTLSKGTPDVSFSQFQAALDEHDGAEQGATGRTNDPVYHVFRLTSPLRRKLLPNPSGVSKLGMIRSPTSMPKTNTKAKQELLTKSGVCSVAVDKGWRPDPDRGNGNVDTEWIALRKANHGTFEQHPVAGTFKGANPSTVARAMWKEGHRGVFALSSKDSARVGH